MLFGTNVAGDSNGFETRPSADHLLTECLQPRCGIKAVLSLQIGNGFVVIQERKEPHPSQQVLIEALESSLGLHNALP